jgi:hypothetical protein
MHKVLVLLVLSVVSLLATSELKKLQYIGTVKDIIISTQKIRGGTFNFLNGSTAAQFIVYDERSNQKKAFRLLAYQSNRISSVRLTSEFDNLRKQMNSLNNMAFELDPVMSFSAYCTLIKKMLKTDQQMQEIFFNESSPMIKSVTKVMTNDLLPLSEEVGKLRGLGSGIIAKTVCDDEEIAMLKESINEIKVCLKNTIDHLQSLNSRYSQQYPKDFSDRLAKLSKEIGHYVQFAETRLLEKKNITADSDQYFADGTRLISGVMELYKVNENILLSTTPNSIGHIASTTNP